MLNEVIELPESWLWTIIGEITESMQNGIYKPSSTVMMVSPV